MVYKNTNTLTFTIHATIGTSYSNLEPLFTSEKESYTKYDVPITINTLRRESFLQTLADSCDETCGIDSLWFNAFHEVYEVFGTDSLIECVEACSFEL